MMLKDAFKLVEMDKSSKEIGLFKLAGVNLDRDNSMISDTVELIIMASDMALSYY